MRRLPTVVPFALLALVWGSSFLLIAVALRGLDPGQVAGGRILLGATALLAVVTVTRHRLPRGLRVWGHLAVVGVLLCVVPFWLFAVAEERISSGLASILNATTPLMTAAITLVALRCERPDVRRLVALLVGLVGVVVVMAPWAPGDGSGGGSAAAADPVGVLACLGATACYGAAFVYLRRFVVPLGLQPLAVAAGQVGAAAGVTLLLSPWLLAGGLPTREGAATSVVALVALGVLGTGLAYVWNTRVVTDWGATRAASVTYLTPLVGVVAGAVVLDERVGWHQSLGAALVLAGALLARPARVTGRRARRPVLGGPRRPGTAPHPTAR